MGLRVEVQKKLITLFREGSFPSVSYNSEGIPSVGGNLVPSVICNEVASGIQPQTGMMGRTYNLSGWSFEVICTFSKEVDISDFILNELKDLQTNINSSIIQIKVGSSLVVKHPPRQGATEGTILQMNFNVETRR